MIFSSPFAGGGVRGFGDGYYPDEDMVLLRGVEDFLQGTGVIFTDESRPKYGRINVRAEERRSAAKR